MILIPFTVVLFFSATKCSSVGAFTTCTMSINKSLMSETAPQIIGQHKTGQHIWKTVELSGDNEQLFRSLPCSEKDCQIFQKGSFIPGVGRDGNATVH